MMFFPTQPTGALMRNLQPTSRQDAVTLAILSLDLGPIKYKLMTPEGGQMDQSTVEELEIWYKRYLMLIHLYPNTSLVPTKHIDTFWHTHILDTMKYATDCEKIFGKFLHHFPYFGVRSEKDRNDLNAAWESTRKLFQKEFGEDPKFEAGFALCQGGEDCGNGCAVCIEPHKKNKVLMNFERPTVGSPIH